MSAVVPVHVRVPAGLVKAVEDADRVLRAEFNGEAAAYFAYSESGHITIVFGFEDSFNFLVVGEADPSRRATPENVRRVVREVLQRQGS